MTVATRTASCRPVELPVELWTIVLERLCSLYDRPAGAARSLLAHAASQPSQAVLFEH